MRDSLSILFFLHKILSMNAFIRRQFIFLAIISISSCASAQTISLQALLDKLASNNELLKSRQSQVQARQAEVKSVAYNRLPSLNTMYQATVGSDNNVQGPYLGMGIMPSVTGGSRSVSNLNPVGGSTALVGLDWEAINFGGYKAQSDVAKAELLSQSSIFAKTQYDLNGIAAAYYIELLRQSELQTINEENVSRLRSLLTSINGLITNGIRPGVDSSVASSELSKSLVSLYNAQRGYALTQAQLSSLTGLSAQAIIADTGSEFKLITAGSVFTPTMAIDTLHHPDIALYSSLYDLSQAKLRLEKKSYYPKIMLNADAWTRGSSLNSSDHFNSLEQGYIPSRLNYFVGVSMTYDIMNIARKRLGTTVSKYESESSAHRLAQAKIDISNSLQQSLIESDYERKRLSESDHQLHSASIAYEQQANLYRNGLSSIIELDIALSYYIQARKDYLDAKVGYMRSILNYALVTNSFNSMVQTLKL
jgi:outer membrane protein TolC